MTRSTKSRRHHPSLERIRELFDYDLQTGEFRAKTKRIGSKIRVGDLVGCPTRMGYLRVQIDGESWYLHRIAWFLQSGKWVDEVDHRDGDPRNNAWNNLRPCDRAHNNANRRVIGKHGVKGIRFVERLPKPWIAQIMVNKKNHYLGCYPTKEDAHRAYIEASQHFFGDFARGR